MSQSLFGRPVRHSVNPLRTTFKPTCMCCFFAGQWDHLRWAASAVCANFTMSLALGAHKVGGEETSPSGSIPLSNESALPVSSGGRKATKQRVSFRAPQPPHPFYSLNPRPSYLRLLRHDGESACPNASTNQVELHLPDAADDRLALPPVVSLVRILQLQVVSAPRRNGRNLDCAHFERKHSTVSGARPAWERFVPT